MKSFLLIPIFAFFISSTFACAPGEKRISRGGHTFTCDNSVVPFGTNSWRDPSGIIWAAPEPNERPNWYPYKQVNNLSEAKSHCYKRRGRVPSKNDFIKLRDFLGKDYRLPNSKKELLPGSDAWGKYITTTMETNNGRRLPLFAVINNLNPDDPYYGLSSYFYWGDGPYEVRCIANAN